MILLIDNYDSFSYNVYQLVGSVNPDIRVIRNDECSVDEIRAMNPSHIILSPGPGRPDKAGVCENVIRKLGGRIPILGICLGHQAICEVEGATVTYASHLMHGKQSLATLDTDSVLFRGMKKVQVAITQILFYFLVKRLCLCWVQISFYSAYYIIFILNIPVITFYFFYRSIRK